jgi:hypothetical protein
MAPLQLSAGGSIVIVTRVLAVSGLRSRMSCLSWLYFGPLSRIYLYFGCCYNTKSVVCQKKYKVWCSLPPEPSTLRRH